jgi:hypothetical protein
MKVVWQGSQTAHRPERGKNYIGWRAREGKQPPLPPTFPLDTIPDRVKILFQIHSYVILTLFPAWGPGQQMGKWQLCHRPHTLAF